jgi:hypothetical protein
MLEAAPFEERGGNSHFTSGAFRFAFASMDDLIAVLPSLAQVNLVTVDFAQRNGAHVGSNTDSRDAARRNLPWPASARLAIRRSDALRTSFQIRALKLISAKRGSGSGQTTSHCEMLGINSCPSLHDPPSPLFRSPTTLTIEARVHDLRRTRHS